MQVSARPARVADHLFGNPSSACDFPISYAVSRRSSLGELDSTNGKIAIVEAHQVADDQILLRMSRAEAIVLHELIASSEWSSELENLELQRPAEREIVSRIQQSLAPLISQLGTDHYGTAVDAAISEIGDVHRE
ncbi:hypothetical protein [Rudaeicoccus suwonensis]|uniref:hypothetical protein n=1 Tax=Rudaeicoccus suwonensis TaxID=657409 RepID=UPI001477195D|nr:hypothetical protein [Rudaeicoccus suwonensis]